MEQGRAVGRLARVEYVVAGEYRSAIWYSGA